MTDKVSVVIPVFNREKTIIRCLESIINQTYINIEVVIVDDASFDNTVSIVSKYALKDNRIKLVCMQENGG